ncbi:unnamed protein product, partial [Musa textilis]
QASSSSRIFSFLSYCSLGEGCRWSRDASRVSIPRTSVISLWKLQRLAASKETMLISDSSQLWL